MAQKKKKAKSSDAKPPEAILDYPLINDLIHNSFFVLQSMVSAIKLGIPDILAKWTMTLEELALESKVSTDAMSVLLSTLTVLGLVSRDNGLYSLTEVGKECEDKPENYCVHAIKLWTHPKVIQGLLHTHEGLTKGISAFHACYGKPFYEVFQEDPELGALFNKYMASVTRFHNPEAIVSAYDFSKYQNIVDVGGGTGSFLLSLLKNNKNAFGTLLERSNFEEQNFVLKGDKAVEGRYKIVLGDLMKSIPKGGDLYVLKHIIHNWSYEDAKRILTNVRNAMTMKSRVVLVEFLKPGHSEFLMDIKMFLLFGGRERFEEEYQALFEESGFTYIKKHPVPSAGIYILEAKPKRRSQK